MLYKLNFLMTAIRKTTLQVAYFQVFTNLTTELYTSNDRFGFKLLMENNDKATYLYQLGARYYWGDDNTERDLDKAIEYLQKAADMGHDMAQNLLGVCFETGEGVEQNHEKAIELYTKASKQGNEYALYNLACYYEKGEGIEQDYEKTVELYTEAARRGYSKAQLCLGTLYYYADYGVEQDYEDVTSSKVPI